MKKLLLFIVVGMFLISLTSAEIQTLGNVRQGESINLIQTCASCTFNNITSVVKVSQNHREIIGNFQMDRTGSVYNFTLSSGNISDLGEYIVNGIGDLDGTNTIWNYNFFVTADGNPVSPFPNQFFVIIFGLALILFGLLNERYRLIKHMGSIIFMIMGVLTLYPGYNFINHTTLFGQVLGFSLVAMGFWFLIEDSFSRGEQEQTFEQKEEED